MIPPGVGPSVAEQGQEMLVSVVIPSRNRAARLDRALRALSSQTAAADSFEIVVVSDASVDETAAICRGWQRRMPQLHLVELGHRSGAAGAANAGIETSRGDMIILTDDDCIPAPDWIERMRAALERHPIVAGAVDSPRDDFFKLSFNLSVFHRFFPRRRGGQTRFLAGANYGFRREVLDALDGLDPSRRFAGDMDLALRAQAQGYGIYFEPKAVVVHDHDRDRPGDLLRYSASHARWTIQLRNRHSDLMQTPVVLRSAPLLLASSPFIALWVTIGLYTRNPRLLRFAHTAPMVFASKLAWCLGASVGLTQLHRDHDA